MSAPEPKSPEEPWEDPYPHPKPSLPRLTGLFLLLLVYVLGIGPACRLAQNGTIAWDTVHLIYTPLNLAAKLRPVDTLVQWYIRDVWQVKAQRIKPSSP